MKLNLFDSEVYKNRRAVLADSVGSGLILLFGNGESSINFKDNWYPFRQDSSFLYYIGLNIPDLNALIDAGTGKTILFANDLSIEDIIWTGPLPTMKELATDVGIEEVKPADAIKSYLVKDVHYLPPYRAEHILKLTSLLNKNIEEIEEGASITLIESVINQRNTKSPEEISSLHEACTLTSRMHLEVITKTKEGMYEYELVGMANAFGAKSNSAFSFQPICTINGHILHNHSYDNKLSSGKMVLFDGGLYSKMNYAGDMTRTFPVDRKFSALQADLYNIVLSGQKAAVRAIRPGITFLEIHLKSAKAMVDGLIDFGIMKGNAEEAVNAGAHTLFFQHGLGHMLGLDVHDMESLGEQYVGYSKGMVKSKEFGLKSLRLGRELEEGFVLTIEPGLYLIPQLIDKFEAENKFSAFIDYKEVRKIQDQGGIRIEDDYLVTSDGIELLGEPLAKEISEIEEIRNANK